MLTVHFSHLKKGNNNLRGIPHIHILIRQRQGHNHGVLNVTKPFKYTGVYTLHVTYTVQKRSKKYFSTKKDLHVTTQAL
jgi:hypothetical protein